MASAFRTRPAFAPPWTRSLRLCLALGALVSACGGSPAGDSSSGGASGTQGAGGGGATGPGCVRLTLCCASIQQASLKQTCTTTALQISTQSNADALCTQIEQGYAKAGLCDHGAGGSPEQGGAGGTSPGAGGGSSGSGGVAGTASMGGAGAGGSLMAGMGGAGASAGGHPGGGAGGAGTGTGGAGMSGAGMSGAGMSGAGMSGAGGADGAGGAGMSGVGGSQGSSCPPGIDAAGCCDVNGDLLYCSKGAPKFKSCNDTCGWDSNNNFYDCMQAGLADPSGQHPQFCPGSGGGQGGQAGSASQGGGPGAGGQGAGAGGAGGQAGESGQAGSGAAIPPGWTCKFAWYADGTTCDCGCGVHDPDCDIPGAPMRGMCAPNQTCDITDTCQGVPSCLINGKHCGTSAECCMGYCNSSSVCGKVPKCVASGLACTATQMCCSGALCPAAATCP